MPGTLQSAFAAAAMKASCVGLTNWPALLRSWVVTSLLVMA